jgi:hypothetical protein
MTRRGGKSAVFLLLLIRLIRNIVGALQYPIGQREACCYDKTKNERCQSYRGGNEISMSSLKNTLSQLLYRSDDSVFKSSLNMRRINKQENENFDEESINNYSDVEYTFENVLPTILGSKENSHSQPQAGDPNPQSIDYNNVYHKSTNSNRNFLRRRNELRQKYNINSLASKTDKSNGKAASSWKTVDRFQSPTNIYLCTERFHWTQISPISFSIRGLQKCQACRVID